MSVSDDTCGIVAASLTAMLLCGCTALDGLTRIAEEAGSGAPKRQNDASPVLPDGSRDSSVDRATGSNDARDHEDGSVDAARDHEDGSVDAARDHEGGSVDAASDRGYKDGAGDGLGWTAVASELEVRKHGVVYVLGSRKRCSGVLVTHHWVLTAAHCLCYNDVGTPKGVAVHGGARRLTDTPIPEMSFYRAEAAQVVLHPTYDVALIELQNALPFTVTPLLYDGVDGLDLKNKVGRAWGFGPNRLDDVGQPVGGGETLSSSALSIQGVGEVGPQLERVADCELRLEQRSSLGPLALPVSGLAPKPVEESEGGPLFVGGDDPETRVLVGILKGTTDSAYAFTGIWAIRDWIRETATDVSSRRNCSQPLPVSLGMSKPAVTEGPDGTIHVVAVSGADGTLHHWRRAPDGRIDGPTVVPQAHSDLLPSLAKESRAPAGEPVKIGLVFRDAGTKEVKYARLSSGTSWSTPIVVPGSRNARAVALDGGIVAFVGSDGRMVSASYDFEEGPRPFPDVLTTNIDVNRGFSTHYAAGNLGFILWAGYRTPRNEWVEILGTFRSVDGGLVWRWENSVPSVPTGWQHAVLSGSPRGGGTIVATRPAGAFSVVEHHLAYMSQTEPMRLIQVGSNRLKVQGEIAAGFAEPDDIWIVTQSIVGTEPTGLMLRRSTDCFANDW
jgi:hypothetical protein